jgi:GAF domain-containing protein
VPSDVALVRIWLLRPGDICSICRMRPECPDQSRCLHLAASSGKSLAEPGADWTRIDGDFRRFPVGVRKVGQIAATGIPLFVADTAEQSEWIARPQWAACEHIRSFAGQPLMFGGETLGVIAVFSRVELGELDFRWLRLFADQAAITIVNARAFEEIEQLKRRLQLENEYLREEISQSHIAWASFRSRYHLFAIGRLTSARWPCTLWGISPSSSTSRRAN